MSARLIQNTCEYSSHIEIGYLMKKNNDKYKLKIIIIKKYWSKMLFQFVIKAETSHYKPIKSI